MDQQSCSSNAKSCCDKGFCCPLTGFKFSLSKKFIAGSVIMIVWMNLFSWLWHGKVMSGMYQATASLWRAPQDMKSGLLSLGISIMAVVATYIFMKGYEGKGIREGLRFGIIIALLSLGMGLVTNATQLIPIEIIQMWVLGDLIGYGVGATVLSIAFKSCKSCS